MQSPATSWLPVRSVEFEVLGDLAFPAVAIREQPFLVVIELFTRLGSEFEIRSFHDGIDRTRLLAHPAIDALHHVDVVTRRAAAAVCARLCFDRDGLCRADRLAKLAGYAALFAVGIAAQRVLAAEARAERSLFKRIVDRRLGFEEVTGRKDERLDEFPKEDLSCRAV